MPKNVEETEAVSESYISIGLGILVVVVVGILLYNFFTQKDASKNPESKLNEVSVDEEATKSAKPGNTYTVVAGDTLWSIAEKSYKSGYNWVNIAKANNLTNEEELKVGQQLLIPEASPIIPLSEQESGTTSAEITKPLAKLPVTTITESTYTVVTGDNLWNIACRAYGDCYAWTKIAQTNKLTNPDLIYAGNVLNLPR